MDLSDVRILMIEVWLEDVIEENDEKFHFFWWYARNILDILWRKHASHWLETPRSQLRFPFLFAHVF